MPSKLSSHLMRNRHGTFYLRLIQNGKERRKSLRTKDLQEAQIAAYEFGHKLSLMKKKSQPPIIWATQEEVLEQLVFEEGVRKFEAQKRAFERIKSLEDKVLEEDYFQILLNLNPHLNASHTQPPKPPPLTSSITIEQACEKYLSACKTLVTSGTHRTWVSCLNKLKTQFSDREINSIRKDEITDMITNPRGGKSQGTITKDSDAWFLMWKWLVDHDFADKNPVIKPKFGRTLSARLKDEYGRNYIPFNDADIKILFNKERLDSLKKPEEPWLLIIGLFTGARLEAISRLRVKDITNESIHFTVAADKVGGERLIPIHPLLIDAGLLIYKREIEDKFGADSYLFTEMLEISGRRSHAFSQRFRTYREKAGLQKGKVFHSFRGTLISRLDKNGAGRAVRRLYAGHEVGEEIDIEDRHYLKSEYTIKEISERIFPFLHYELDGWIYTPKSALISIEAIQSKREISTLRAKRNNKKAISTALSKKDKNAAIKRKNAQEQHFIKKLSIKDNL